jgi:hypothetical protein
MGQYKKNFTHNAVDGCLLLALDTNMLKHELKISSFGHRVAICEAIQQLRGTVPEGYERSLSPEARSGLIKGSSTKFALSRPFDSLENDCNTQ